MTLGHRFQSRRLERALTHRSHRQSAAASITSASNFSATAFSAWWPASIFSLLFLIGTPGNLSKGLARLVSASSIHAAAQRLQLGAHLRLGPGEEKTGGREKKRLLADAYEAISARSISMAAWPGGGVFSPQLARSRARRRSRRPRARRPQIRAAGMASAARARHGRIPPPQ